VDAWFEFIDGEGWCPMTRKKPSLKRKSAKPPKPRLIEHRSLGACTVVGVYLTDAGSIVADVDVAGVRRTLSLDQGYWLSPITDLLAAMPPQSRPACKEKPVREAEPTAAEPEEAELVPDVDGHLREIDPPADEDEDVEREEGELASNDVLQ
jgi:hypothetical protein